MVPAVAAVVVNRDGELFLDAAGKLDAKAVPMTPNAIFRIASMTKPVTSLAVMMLVEQGKIHVEDRVTKYLPEFARREVVLTRFKDDGSYETRPAKRPVTIRDLLTHTSGHRLHLLRCAARPGGRFRHGGNGSAAAARPRREIHLRDQHLGARQDRRAGVGADGRPVST
jgi:CubicO group peptidase (beta-lactamase class C family)